MSRVRVGGTEVAYEVQGEGEPVVLVHGSAGSRLTWAQQTPALAERWQVVLPELAGSGETVDPGGPLEVDDLAAQVVGVADHLGLDRFHLAGYSLGAVVAATVAAGHPARVRSLGLLAGWAVTDARMRFTFDLWQRLLRADPQLFARYALADGYTRAWFEAPPADPEELLPLVAGGLAPGSDRHAELDARVDISHRLHAVTAPTLVIGGREDRWVPIEHSRHLATAIAGARLVELDTGHLVLGEAAAQVTDHLSALFASH